MFVEGLLISLSVLSGLIFLNLYLRILLAFQDRKDRRLRASLGLPTCGRETTGGRSPHAGTRDGGEQVAALDRAGRADKPQERQAQRRRHDPC